MSETGTSKLSPVNAAFAMAATLTVLCNTVLACAKDAYHPLKVWMASLTGSDWTTQGLSAVILFIALGFVFQKTKWPSAIESNRLITILAGATVLAGLGLLVWYALF